MSRILRLAPIAILTFLAACSSSSNNNNNSGGGQPELSDGTVGSSCSDSCATGLQCVTGEGVPNGYCTRACSKESQCAPEGHCIQTSSDVMCFRGCTSDSECRPGYTCQSAGSVSVCYPGTPQTENPPPDTNACKVVADPAKVTGGCNIGLAQPAVCQVVDLTGGKGYSFEWTTHTTNCETPFYLVIAGNPPSEANSVSWSLSDGSNNGLIGSNTGGVWTVYAKDLVNLKSDNGLFHWEVRGYYGSHPDSRAIYIKR